MKPVKFVLLGCAALAMLLVFVLPYAVAGPVEFTLWKLRNISPEETIIHPYGILATMALPVIFGALSLSTQRLPRWQAIVSVICFAVSLLFAFTVFSKLGTSFGEASGVGAKIMIVALLGGFAAAVAGIVKPERA